MGSRAQTSLCLRAAHGAKRMHVANTCPYLTLATTVTAGHQNTTCREISASTGEHVPATIFATAMPAIATSVMAEIISKQTALGCSCKQNVGMSRSNYHKHDTAPFCLYNRSITASRYISDHRDRSQKKPGKRRLDGSRAWTSRCLRKGGGGYISTCARTRTKRIVCYQFAITASVSPNGGLLQDKIVGIGLATDALAKTLVLSVTTWTHHPRALWDTGQQNNRQGSLQRIAECPLCRWTAG